ncbi:MAG: formimidoylglutamase [Bacteroidota bacterium]
MYAPTPHDCWKGRVDPEDGDLGLRWHQMIQLRNLSLPLPTIEIEGTHLMFVGFECEDGVARNQGRLGAKEGPLFLRKAMANFAHHLPAHVHLYDGGTVICGAGKLAAAQQQLSQMIQKAHAAGYQCIVLGGGHEVAWGSFGGLVPQLSTGKKLGILNFDAHFDLRKPSKGPSSGTPFYQIADWCTQHSHEFHYLCWGIQPMGNTQALFATAQELPTDYLTMPRLAEMTTQAQILYLNRFLAEIDHLYLSIDLDGFDVAYAPGVSATNVGGLVPQKVFPLLRLIAQSGKLVLVDVAELNPTYDIDGKTAKLGARCLWELIQHR